jgi:hypothetical protein
VVEVRRQREPHYWKELGTANGGSKHRLVIDRMCWVKALFNVSAAGRPAGRAWVAEGGDGSSGGFVAASAATSPTNRFSFDCIHSRSDARFGCLDERSIVWRLKQPQPILGAGSHEVVNDLAERGRRVLAVVSRWHPGEPEATPRLR